MGCAMKQIKTMICIPSLGVGGAETMVENLVMGLKNITDVFLLKICPLNLLKHSSYNIHQYKIFHNNFSFLRNVPQFCRYFLIKKYD